MAPYERGDVIWHPAPFRDGGRPYVVLSDDDHPFYGEEYAVVGVTTTERERGVALTSEAWNEGGAPKPSWASPWYVLTINTRRSPTDLDGSRPRRPTTSQRKSPD